MEINDTLFNLTNALGIIEEHAENLKKAIAIAEEIKKRNGTGMLTDEEDSFLHDAGYSANRLIRKYDNYGELEVDYFFRILNAVEEFNKVKQ
jgi:predicted transcriptional regulator YheO